jgi:hypothetical protein
MVSVAFSLAPITTSAQDILSDPFLAAMWNRMDIDMRESFFDEYRFALQVPVEINDVTDDVYGVLIYSRSKAPFCKARTRLSALVAHGSSTIGFSPLRTDQSPEILNRPTVLQQICRPFLAPARFPYWRRLAVIPAVGPTVCARCSFNMAMWRPLIPTHVTLKSQGTAKSMTSRPPFAVAPAPRLMCTVFLGATVLMPRANRWIHRNNVERLCQITADPSNFVSGHRTNERAGLEAGRYPSLDV